MRNDTNKLNQLTSLRFFAAFMIVIHHSVNLFGIQYSGIHFGQGVSFFFVLSGFILTYVYPKLETWRQIKQFWRARIARIWPAYLVSFCLGFWLLHYHWDNKIAAANLLMVQAWLPLSTYYFSYNAVAWSVSTEFFFYLVFPAILYKWSKTWRYKLLFSGAIVLSLMGLCNLLQLPSYGSPLEGANGLLVTQHGILYINPISRVFEFIFGMCMALAYRWCEVKWTVLKGTIYELGAVILCSIPLFYIDYIAGWFSHTILGASLSIWVMHSGPMFVFGLLIYIMAHGRGKISEALAHPFLVVLGEISFSLYLIHQILLVYYRQNIAGFSHLSNPVAFSVFISVLLLSSYLMWTVVEMPGRRLIIGHQKIHGTPVMKTSWQNHLALSWKPILVGLVLCTIIGFLYITMGKP
jgi:peptidoglycan/LPS O-acetylase OafA/YrhL